MMPTSQPENLSPGSAVEVRFVRYAGVTEDEVTVEQFWRAAAVSAVGASGLGIVFADSTRMMVRNGDWRRPAP